MRLHALKPYRRRAPGFPDLLNWGAVVDDGVVLNKDGSLMAGYFYRGQDLAAVPPAEINRICGVVNAAFARLGGEWMLHQDALRVPSRSYPSPEDNAFPDPVTTLIERERRGQFGRDGAYYESVYAFVLTYLPPLVMQERIAGFFFTGGPRKEQKSTSLVGEKAIAHFKTALAEFEDRLASAVYLERMRGHEAAQGEPGRIYDEFLQYLHGTLSGDSHPIVLPACPMYLDYLISGHEFHFGIVPRIEDQYIRVVSIDGFPLESYPGVLDALGEIPSSYRWSTRFLFQDAVQAQTMLRGYRRKWQQKVRGFLDQIFYAGRVNRNVDQDAVEMVAQTESALAEAASGLVLYGHYTSVVVLMDGDEEQLAQAARQVKRTIDNLGFNARIETVNTVEAWLGSLPGHANPNLRRVLLHTLHLATLLPLSAVWPGRDRAPCPMYPEGSPPLLQAATDGSTPFRLNLHVGDVGHTLMLGPTGAGKSTALALIAAQFRRYAGATVFAFDKGNSLETLTRAVGGRHYNIAGDADESDLCFSPLAQLDRPGELGWAEDWLEILIELQGEKLNASKRDALHQALIGLRDGGGERTLTNLQIQLQHDELRSALKPYTIAGALGQLLDALDDGLATGSWSCFEIGALMNREDIVRLPVLLYLFRVIERQLRGQPALIILDEAWLMLGNPVFRSTIRTWLKTLRKANCAVLLATQSLSDAANSGILDVLVESCPTRIFLANREATSEDIAPLYQRLGCNPTETRLIADMVPKRQYFVRGEGRRRVDLALGPVALAFCGVSSPEDIARVRQLEQQHGRGWPSAWLQERGVIDDARH